MKSMLKWIKMMMILCFFAGIVSVQANSNKTGKGGSLDLKFYIQPEQISLDNNKIYVNFEDDLIYEVPAIFSDERGYYFESIAKSGDCSWYEWECERCRTCNLRGVDWRCRACGLGISEKPKKSGK
jgi:hypothetical protein